ncbi:hypothetical protein BU16DRAFT_537793 [Lophium mytilinum]|uniref:Uncharacterized protein n=1 Tax=Lophium mytilinum TaxID=390894 RepID=A0A6A6QXV4_9PEZI|nr:hypothetical protein BU16DRAFT_537793 [Lophium mytilinum]
MPVERYAPHYAKRFRRLGPRSIKDGVDLSELFLGLWCDRRWDGNTPNETLSGFKNDLEEPAISRRLSCGSIQRSLPGKQTFISLWLATLSNLALEVSMFLTRTRMKVKATLAGFEQAFLAMTDDMLVTFGSAQLVVGNFSPDAPAFVHVNAIRFRTRVYIYAIFFINSLVVLLFMTKALHTRNWRELINFDYPDSRNLILGVSIDGRSISDADMGRKAVRLENQDGMVKIEVDDMMKDSVSDASMSAYSLSMSQRRASPGP